MSGRDSHELLHLLQLDSEPLALYAALHLEGVRVPELRAALVDRLASAGPELAAAIMDRLDEIEGPRDRLGTLEEILETGSEAAQVRALRCWAGVLGPELDAFLLPWFEREDVSLHVLATVLGVLREVPGPMGDDLLRQVGEALSHKDPRVRSNAAELVAVRGGGELREPLRSMLEDRVPRVRAGAARAVWSFDPDAVGERLERDLNNGDRRDLLAALHVLGVLDGYPEAVALLCEKLSHPEPQVRLMALRSLAGREGDLDPVWLAERYLEEDSSACRQMLSERAGAGLRDAFCDRLLEELRIGEDPHRRSAAARGLGEAGGPEQEVALVSWVLDEDDRVRADVVESLGRMGGAGIDPVLWHAVQDGAPRVAANAALALWKRGGEDALALLVEWLRGQDLARAASAAFALGEIGSDQVIGPLLEIGERLQAEGTDSFSGRGLLKQIMKALTKVRGA